VRWEGHAAFMREMSNVYKILVWKYRQKRPLGRPRREWENNITIDMREIGWEGVDWMQLAQDREQWWVVVNTNDPSGYIKGGEILD
jgi:hypothetical protein